MGETTPISLMQQVHVFYRHVQVNESCWETLPFFALCSGTSAYLLPHVTVRKSFSLIPIQKLHEAKIKYTFIPLLP